MTDESKYYDPETGEALKVLAGICSTFVYDELARLQRERDEARKRAEDATYFKDNACDLLATERAAREKAESQLRGAEIAVAEITAVLRDIEVCAADALNEVPGTRPVKDAIATLRAELRRLRSELLAVATEIHEFDDYDVHRKDCFVCRVKRVLDDHRTALHAAGLVEDEG
mgnify:CR=1 FL=1